MVKHAFPDHHYVSLEDLDQRELAELDPRGFLNQLSGNTILEETQHCPALFSYIQTHVDEKQQSGEFILTGSRQFGLRSVITQSVRAYLLLPHHGDSSQCMIKMPKLYFMNTGLAIWLLGIQSCEQLVTHSQRVALFESWAISELLKACFNAGKGSNLYFWRYRSGHEVDLLVDHGTEFASLEIKSGQTVNQDYSKELDFWQELASETAGQSWLVYEDNQRQMHSNVAILPWHEFNPEQIANQSNLQVNLDNT